MRVGRAILGGLLAEALLIVVVVPGAVVGSESVVTWSAVIGAPVVTFLAALWVTAAGLLAGSWTQGSGRCGRWIVCRPPNDAPDHRDEGQRMKSACLAASLLVFVMSASSTTQAQRRGRLTSQAPAPATAPQRALRSPLLLPAWTLWGIATLPESTQIAPPIAQGAPTGGVQLDVQPWSAEVYVDGTRAGRVEDFGGYYRHLDLPAGPHTIAIVATGYEPMIVGVMVIPGKTVTYRATLQR